MKWVAIALFALAGFLIGGVSALWKNDARRGAIICAVFAAAAVVGGVLYLLS